MKPVLAAWPPKKRTMAFAPLAVGIWLLTALILAFATQLVFLVIILPPVLAVGGAYALVGWPEVRMKDGKPLVEPHLKPYLFFALAPLFALILYPILGMLLMMVGLPPTKWLAILTIVLAAAIGIGAAYFLVGVPNVIGSARKQYAAIPPERRPFLFFPLFVVFFLVLFLTLGVVTTKLVPRVSPSDPEALLNIQVLVLMPVCLALAGLLAWLLVGIPKVLTAPASHMPKMPGRHRPRAFFVTLLLVGIPLTLISGALLTYYSPLPSTLALALALALGYLMAVGISLLAWGTPARWREHEDYRPALPERAHRPLMIALALLLGVAVIVGFGLAQIDLFWGVLVGALVAGIAVLLVTGGHRHVLARRGQSTIVPDLPDAMKPIILFPTWFLISFVLFAVMTYMLPGLVAVNALVAILVGLAVTFLLLEQPLLKELRAERARERQKRKEWEARRRARLDEAAETKGPTKPDA